MLVANQPLRNHNRDREVTEVDAKSVTIKLADEVEGILKASDISREKVLLKVGFNYDSAMILLTQIKLIHLKGKILDFFGFTPKSIYTHSDSMFML